MIITIPVKQICFSNKLSLLLFRLFANVFFCTTNESCSSEKPSPSRTSSQSGSKHCFHLQCFADSKKQTQRRASGIIFYSIGLDAGTVSVKSPPLHRNSFNATGKEEKKEKETGEEGKQRVPKSNILRCSAKAKKIWSTKSRSSFSF